MKIRRKARRLLRRLKGKLVEPTHHFIHIPKNAGNAVREALGARVSLTEPYHYRYIDIADVVGRDLRFFCVVRNPWSRTASRFLFARQNALKWPVDDPRRVYITTASFRDYVMDRKIFEIPQHPGRPWMGPMNSWFNQLFWITDETGAVACDCLRLEYIEDDLSDYFGRRIRVPPRNVTSTRIDYRRMYDDALIETVADMFREDIEYFGFAFEGAATRNTIAQCGRAAGVTPSAGIATVGQPRRWR